MPNNRIPVTQTDVDDPIDRDIIDDQVAGITDGILQMADQDDPNFSGRTEPRLLKPEGQEGEGEGEVEGEGEGGGEGEGQQTQGDTGDQPELYTIKWQGQEKDLSIDEIIRLAQQGFDYTQKTQKLSEERDQLAPFMGLAKKIQEDPVLASNIAAYLRGGVPPQAQAQGQPPKQQQMPKMFDDPIEQLKWETKEIAKREAIAEVTQMMAQQLQPMQRQQVLNAVKAEVMRDPDYDKVHQAIIDMVASQPPSVQKTLYLQLDQDPQAYTETFQYFKQQLAQGKPNANAQQPVKEGQIVKKVTKAPILDAGGVPVRETASKEKRQRLNREKEVALRSGDSLQLADWLERSGAIDHLF